MILAEKVPAAMIFLRTPGGISHAPEETVEIDGRGESARGGLASARVCSRRQPAFKGERDLHNLGRTRSSQQPSHLLLDARHFCARPAAGDEGIAPPLCMSARRSARHSRNTRRNSKPAANWAARDAQRFVFVLEGSVKAEAEGKQTELGARGYAYFPEGLPHRIVATQSEPRCGDREAVSTARLGEAAAR